MISNRTGVTLVEIIVVVIIVAIAAVFFFPDYSNNTGQARAQVAINNLLAIYSAEQNFNNNNGQYCYAGNTNGQTCSSLPDINAKLSLNLQDDGKFTYICLGGIPNCQATNSSYSATPILIWLTGDNGAIQYPLSKNANPTSADCPGAKCPF